MPVRSTLLLATCLTALGCSGPPAPPTPAPAPGPAAAEEEPAVPAPAPTPGPVTAEDKRDAVRLILSWLQGKQRLPGFNEDYPDAHWMKGDGPRPTFLVCDFLPANLQLTVPARFRRISHTDYDEMVKGLPLEQLDEKGGLLVISSLTEDRDSFTFEVNNIIGPRAGHRYRFMFRKTSDGLRATGHLEVVN